MSIQQRWYIVFIILSRFIIVIGTMFIVSFIIIKSVKWLWYL